MPITDGAPQATLRDTIAAAYEEAETAAIEETHAAPAAESPPAPEPAKAEERARGPDGKFVAKAEGSPDETPPKAVVAEPQVPPAAAMQRPKPPSSWKKDYHADWEKIDPRVAEYINQREGEYAKGVSTYKTEYERLAPIGQAIEPFLPALRQHNIDPGQWIGNLGRAHELLVNGTPEQKLGMALKLFRDYNIPVQQLFAQGQDGKVYFNPQVAPYQPPAPQVDVNALVERKIAEMYSKQQITGFEQQRDAAGNPAHPHYDTVRETMAQLLDAGLADDLDSAYTAALAHPRHSELMTSIRKQQDEAAKAETARKAAEQAKLARRNAVSPRGATPASAAAGSGKKGSVRSVVEDAYEQHSGDRV